MFTDELIQKLKIYLQIDGLTIIDTQNFEQFTDKHMLVIGIDTITQINTGLNDYEYAVNIALNSFISEDLSGEEFKYYRKIITNRLLSVNNSIFDEVFLEIPVIGYIFENTAKSVTQESNIQTFTFKIYTSID